MFNTRTCKQCIYPDKVSLCVCVTERERNSSHWLDHIKNIRFNSSCHILRETIETGIFNIYREECDQSKNVVTWGHLSKAGLSKLDPRES